MNYTEPGKETEVVGKKSEVAGKETEAERRCSGPCGRLLPCGSFRRVRPGSDRLRGRCRDCEAGRPVRDDGPLAALSDRELAAGYEALRRDVLARMRRPDDPGFADLADEIEIRTRERGPVVGASARFAWGWREQAVARVPR